MCQDILPLLFSLSCIDGFATQLASSSYSEAALSWAKIIYYKYLVLAQLNGPTIAKLFRLGSVCIQYRAELLFPSCTGLVRPSEGSAVGVWYRVIQGVYYIELGAERLHCAYIALTTVPGFAIWYIYSLLSLTEYLTIRVGFIQSCMENCCVDHLWKYFSEHG